MSKNTVIKIENVSKMYDLGLVGTGTLSKDLNRTWAKLRGKPDPYATLAELNVRSEKSKSNTVWALQDINFEVKQGEVLGIIGKNGAGKSTLLKILSRITTPTTGIIKMKGRVGSLLEVGTGMHPEMTARQNVFLNGAIMGMTRAEVKRKLDEIVDFAGIGKYIDTPIKRFSSGMKVRLGFAVAAFLEPEILIVDEVLAVGDAEFQKKAIGKMQDVSKGDGRTVLFVSHNMGSVQNLCNRAMLLTNGKVEYVNKVESVIQTYLSIKDNEKQIDTSNRKGLGFAKIENIEIYGSNKNSTAQTGQDLNIVFKISHKAKINFSKLRIDFRIDDGMGQRIAWFSNSLINQEKPASYNQIKFVIPKLPLNVGTYYMTVQLLSEHGVLDWIQNVKSFYVTEGDFFNTGKSILNQQSKISIDFTIKYS